jgi:DNA-binding Lrp family transcriptional regulator
VGRPAGGPDEVELDEVDRAIVATLRADARTSVNEVARRAHVSRASAYRRIDALEAAGVLTGYHARVDPRALGKRVAALVLVDADQGSWRGLRAALGEVPGVEWLGLMAGSSDFVLLVRVRDVEELRDTVLERLQEIPAVRSTETVFVLDEDDLRDR